MVHYPQPPSASEMSGVVSDEARRQHGLGATANSGHSFLDPEVDDWQASLPEPHPPLLTRRRRVKRACDECRRQKIKCDGEHPCTHCVVYTYDCTYAPPANRRRNPAPRSVEALECQLQRTEELLKTVLPNVAIYEPDIHAVTQRRVQGRHARDATDATSSTLGSNLHHASQEGLDAQLGLFIESTGLLDLDMQGYYNFCGGSSERSFARLMAEQLNGLLGDSQILAKTHRESSMIDFDTPRSVTEYPFDFCLPNTADLPSQEVAKALCSDALSCACCLLRFIHQPSFYRMFDRIYNIPAKDFGDDENQHLPLLYMMLALGCLFHYGPVDETMLFEYSPYEKRFKQGLKYFRIARRMIDITGCRDITSLQAVLFMVLFLYAFENLSTCHTYIGIALRTSLRMGLHRELCGGFNPIERETRRRVFWAIRKLDIHVSAALGLPVMLSNDDIDQALPIEVDDEYITNDAVLSMPPGQTSLNAASNAHTRLMLILLDVIKHVYPIKGSEQSVQGSSKASCSISHATILAIERDLADWLDKLPMSLRQWQEGLPIEVLRIQQLLRLSYAHVQMVLYRPFLHYVSETCLAGEVIDNRSYACAAAGISVSRNIIHITIEMKQRNLLFGEYWNSMYNAFFAIISLVFFVLENPDKHTSQEILANVNDGKDALNGLARRSMVADRCSTALNEFLEYLPGKLEARPASASVDNKRSAPLVPSPRPGGTRVAVRLPDLARPNSGPLIGSVPGATTSAPPAPLQTSGVLRSIHWNHFQYNTI